MSVKKAAGLVIFRKISPAVVQYLLLQTSYGEHHWTPPKGNLTSLSLVRNCNWCYMNSWLILGHMDPGETDPMVTAIRETQEETGLTQSDFKIYTEALRELEYEVEGKPKQVSYWLAELINPDTEIRLSDEHQDHKWLRMQDACTYAKHYDMQNMFRQYEGYLMSY